MKDARWLMADVRSDKTKVLRILFGRFENFAYLCKQSEQVLGQAKRQSRARAKNEIWLKEVRCMKADG